MKFEQNAQTRTLVVTPEGDLLSTNVAAAREQIYGYFASPSAKISEWNTLQLNLSQVKMVDSAGLNLIVSLVKTMKERNGSVRAIVTNSHVKRTFLFTRLDQQVELLAA